MNKDNLHELINRYENNYYMINDSTHDEKFKWEAVKCFRDIWFSDAALTTPFSELFSKATKQSSVLINNSMTSPTTGIVKLAEVYPTEIERLFREVLFAEYNTIDELQNHMDSFIEQTEMLRMMMFPRFYRYKQDRHAASCYLSFFAPDKHYIYRFSEAEEFAKCIEFGKDLGSGENFRLEHYYELADIVVKTISEHTSLLEKYEKLLKSNNQYYYDESLHLMAFDLIYCCRNYNFYTGLNHRTKKESIKAYTIQMLKKEEEEKKQKRISELEDAVHALSVEMQQYEEISLINVEVTQKQYGTGTVIEQNGSNITVRFDDVTKSFIINKQFVLRPRFENDEAIVEAFTEYDRLKNEMEKLKKELQSL